MKLLLDTFYFLLAAMADDDRAMIKYCYGNVFLNTHEAYFQLHISTCEVNQRKYSTRS